MVCPWCISILLSLSDFTLWTLGSLAAAPSSDSGARRDNSPLIEFCILHFLCDLEWVNCLELLFH